MDPGSLEHQMIIKNLRESGYFTAEDKTYLCELLHPDREKVDLPYSIAHAIVKPGNKSLPHRLRTSSEVYFILEGEGEMHIDFEQALVGSGQAILIPPGCWQYIRNTGTADLKFLCIVYPPWRAEDEKVHEAET
jgi:mannose-6-phosphate isomerase-like protein (cupin superfamily)